MPLSSVGRTTTSSTLSGGVPRGGVSANHHVPSGLEGVVGAPAPSRRLDGSSWFYQTVFGAPKPKEPKRAAFFVEFLGISEDDVVSFFIDYGWIICGAATAYLFLTKVLWLKVKNLDQLESAEQSCQKYGPLGTIQSVSRELLTEIFSEFPEEGQDAAEVEEKLRQEMPGALHAMAHVYYQPIFRDLNGEQRVENLQEGNLADESLVAEVPKLDEETDNVLYSADGCVELRDSTRGGELAHVKGIKNWFWLHEELIKSGLDFQPSHYNLRPPKEPRGRGTRLREAVFNAGIFNACRGAPAGMDGDSEELILIDGVVGGGRSGGPFRGVRKQLQQRISQPGDTEVVQGGLELSEDDTSAQGADDYRSNFSRRSPNLLSSAVGAGASSSTVVPYRSAAGLPPTAGEQPPKYDPRDYYASGPPSAYSNQQQTNAFAYHQQRPVSSSASSSFNNGSYGENLNITGAQQPVSSQQQPFATWRTTNQQSHSSTAAKIPSGTTSRTTAPSTGSGTASGSIPLAQSRPWQPFPPNVQKPAVYGAGIQPSPAMPIKAPQIGMKHIGSGGSLSSTQQAPLGGALPGGAGGVSATAAGAPATSSRGATPAVIARETRSGVSTPAAPPQVQRQTSSGRDFIGHLDARVSLRSGNMPPTPRPTPRM